MDTSRPLKKMTALMAGAIATLLSSVLLALVMFPALAGAYGYIDTGKTASLTIETSAPEGASFALYKVADIDQYAQLILTDAFAGAADLGVDLSATIEENSTWLAYAKTLASYVEDQGIVEIDSGTSFTDLELGLYLVLGATYTVDGYTYSFTPYLLQLPSLSDDDAWVYKLTSEPKYESTLNTCEITVLKVWEGDDLAIRPASISVTLYCNGEAYQTVTLGGENNWSYTFSGLSVLDSWSVAETVPEGYTAEVTYDEGSATFTITNTLAPEEPSSPGEPSSSGGNNPQTGDSALPVLWLVVAALAFVCIGVCLRLRSGREGRED